MKYGEERDGDRTKKERTSARWRKDDDDVLALPGFLGFRKEHDATRREGEDDNAASLSLGKNSRQLFKW